MTLCIAAHCRWDNENVVVAAFDERVENDLVSSNSELKYAPISTHWGALLAGPVSQARELIDLYKAHLRAITDITPANAIEHLRVPIHQLRLRLAEAITSSCVCMSYHGFRQHGKETVSDEMYRHVETQIANQQIDTQLILIGCVNGKPYLFTCAGGEVLQATTFATIGSGSFIAHSVMSQRNHAHYDDITRTIYTVYEAMRLGRNAPGVGPCRFIMIMRPTRDTGFAIGMMHADQSDTLTKCFDALGPRVVPLVLPDLRLRPIKLATPEEPDGWPKNSENSPGTTDLSDTEDNAKADDPGTASGEGATEAQK